MGFLGDFGDTLLRVAQQPIRMFEKVSGAGERVIDAGEKVVDKVGDAAGGVLDGLGGLGKMLGNPVIVVGVLVGAFIILPRLLPAPK